MKLGLAICIALLLIAAFLIYGASSADLDASRYIRLPRDASVLRMKPGEWAGSVEIDFELPNSDNPLINLESIWKDNFAVVPQKEGDRRLYAIDGAGTFRELMYVGKRGQYRYEIIVDK